MFSTFGTVATSYVGCTLQRESGDINFSLFILVIETPSAPTKPSAPVAATRQDVYAGKWQYFPCSVTHRNTNISEFFQIPLQDF